MLGKYDCEVADYISSFCAAGGIVNRYIIITAAKIILSHRNPSLLKEHGSSLNLLGTRVPWKLTYLVRHKGTKTTRKLPPELCKRSKMKSNSNQSRLELVMHEL